MLNRQNLTLCRPINFIGSILTSGLEPEMNFGPSYSPAFSAVYGGYRPMACWGFVPVTAAGPLLI